VQLVDEQDRVLGTADFVHDRLDAFLELAAVLRAGHHHGQVEYDDATFHEQLGNVAFNHALGEAFDDGRLADAGLAEEHRVVLRSAAEDLHRPLDFLLAADDGVELVLLGQFGQVATEAVERRRLGLAAARRFSRSRPKDRRSIVRRLAAFHAVAQQVEDLFANLFELETEVHQNLGGNAFLLAEQAEQNVLGAHVVVVQVTSLFHRVLDDLLGPRRLGQLAHGHHIGAALNELLHLQADLSKSTSRFFSTFAATPLPSLIRPRRMCSVPMYS
jgi:hypothetical protein